MEKTLLLKNETTNKTLAKDVVVAKTFSQRSKGLLGKDYFPEEKTMWIKRCQSIHTFFMKFSLDVVFVNKDLVVTHTLYDLKPWRVTPYYISAASVFEFSSGSLNSEHINIGDQLYVGH